MSKLLVVDDDPNTLASLSRAFRLAGHEAVVCDSAARAIELLQAQRFDMVFSDVVMPVKDGLALLADIRALGIQTPVVMVSGQANVEMAVRATRLGAADFLEKPLSTDKLLITVENTVKLARLEDENRRLKQRIGRQELVWRSPAMATVMSRIDRVAPTETRVCILGETGTGKELVARTIHEKSARRDGPFITLNCAAIPSELIESELFGHEKGSFTGAASRHLGKFEQAHGGTLFLDEIGDMPPLMQAKLLRVLEQREVERIGGDRAIEVNVRVVVATHRNLEDLVRRGQFRQDLYHRIVVFPLLLPPLRDRADDIRLLIDHFASTVAAQNEWPPRAVTSEAYDLLQRYTWPGNVRELRNVVERVLLLADGEVDAATVRVALGQGIDRGSPGVANGTGPLADRLDAFEKELIVTELKRHGHRMTETARSLGLERSHLYKKCEKHGIDVKAERSASTPGSTDL
jgi:two-component system nitrogen regulation response regulator NtrX